MPAVWARSGRPVLSRFVGIPFCPQAPDDEYANGPEIRRRTGGVKGEAVPKGIPEHQSGTGAQYGQGDGLGTARKMRLVS